VSTVLFHGQNVTGQVRVLSIDHTETNQYLTHAPEAVTFWPWNSTVRTDLDIYTGFIPTQLMTNTSGCC